MRGFEACGGGKWMNKGCQNLAEPRFSPKNVLLQIAKKVQKSN
jgi:hypothetical protein